MGRAAEPLELREGRAARAALGEPELPEPLAARAEQLADGVHSVDDPHAAYFTSTGIETSRVCFTHHLSEQMKKSTLARASSLPAVAAVNGTSKRGPSASGFDRVLVAELRLREREARASPGA